MSLAGPELVVGLVSPLGVSNRPLADALKASLDSVGYATRMIEAIDLVRGFLRAVEPVLPRYELYDLRMTLGNRFRQSLGRNDAVALAAMAAIRGQREEQMGDARRPIPRCAYVIRSLKTRQEVDTLRRVYGPHFILIAAHASRERRRQGLTELFLRDHPTEPERCREQAERLMARDEREYDDPHGQDLGDVFHRADVFVDAIEPAPQIQRFIDLVFGHPFRTPTPAELAMFQAFGAALRSSARRQVGATITTKDGDVVALGTNEVARPFGGQYWEGDKHDGRDHRRASNTTDALVDGVLRDLLARLRKKNWLGAELAAAGVNALAARARHELLPPCADGPDDPLSLHDEALVEGLMEFIRPVHAEMAAISSAARRGVSIEGGTLYSTTFPCHECARHIVATGLKEVVFIEPYPKSRVAEMFDDSIVVDDDDCRRVPFKPYVGVAPGLYMQVFRAPRRKDERGQPLVWDAIRTTQKPRLITSEHGYIQAEDDGMSTFLDLLVARGLRGMPTGESHG